MVNSQDSAIETYLEVLLNQLQSSLLPLMKVILHSDSSCASSQSILQLGRET